MGQKRGKRQKRQKRQQQKNLELLHASRQLFIRFESITVLNKKKSKVNLRNKKKTILISFFFQVQSK